MNVLTTLLYGAGALVTIIAVFLSVINLRLLCGTMIGFFGVWLIAGLVCFSFGFSPMFWIKVIGGICLFSGFLMYDIVVLLFLKNGGNNEIDKQCFRKDSPIE